MSKALREEASLTLCGCSKFIDQTNDETILEKLYYCQLVLFMSTMSELIEDGLKRGLSLFGQCFLATLDLLQPAKKNRLPPIIDPLLLKSATELTVKIRSGQLKCTTLTKVFIDRIRSVNHLINAVVADRFDQALEEARILDQRIEATLKQPSGDPVLELPLLGIPFTITESIAVQGMPLTAGMVSRKDFRAEKDSPVVLRLKNAGAIIIAVTNTSEFCLWFDTDNRLYGRTNNPYDLSRISGGSCGGEGAIISAAGSVVGLGSDITGAIRYPANFCGIFGHKPSSGIVPIDGCYPPPGNREKCFTIGPLCRYAVDLRLILKMLIYQSPALEVKLKLNKPVELSKSKFYFQLENVAHPKMCEQVRESILRARNYLAEHCGFLCYDVKLSLLRHCCSICQVSRAEMAAPKLSTAMADGQKLNGFVELTKSIIGSSSHRPITCINMILQDFCPPNPDSVSFQCLIKAREELRFQIEHLLYDDSILILPCVPVKAPKHHGSLLYSHYFGYPSIFNIFEMPVTQVTMGVDEKSGLPFGFQVVAKKFNDRITITVAEMLSRRFGGWSPPSRVEVKT